MRLRLPRLSYANVAATLALLIAVAGTGGGEAIAKAVRKLANNSVTTKAIRNSAVTGAKVKDRSLTSFDVAFGALGGAEIKDGSLGGADIADGSLGGADIADGSLGSQDIGRLYDQNFADGSVNSRVIADNSITSADIANGTIGTDDIGPMTIRGGIRSEVATDAEVGNIAPSSITKGNLSQSAIDFLTQTWGAGPISKGSTVTGFSGVAFVASLTKDNAIVAAGTEGATPEKRSVSVSFPAQVTGLDHVRIVPPEQVDPLAADCPGTFAAPRSKAGVACVYVRGDGSGQPVGQNVGAFDVLDQSDFGFALGYQPPAAGWTFAQVSWAFTRPAA